MAASRQSSTHKMLLPRILIGVLIVILVAFTVPIPFSTPRVSTPEYDPATLQFPKDFFWGSSTSSHQVEGGNRNDWTEWENENAQRLAGEAESKFGKLPSWNFIKSEATNPQNYISDKAGDHYNLYPEDIRLMKELGLNTYRFSIEWSRIEPEDGKFNQAEMDHYKQVLSALRAAGIEPFVTLWHRTQPLWVAGQDEWENKATIEDFKEYAEYVAKNLGPDVTYWMTFNEPELHLGAGYIEGSIPPGVKSITRGQKAFANMIEAHRQAYAVIHQVDGNAQVGNTHAMQLGAGFPKTIANMVTAKYLDSYANWKFLDETRSQTDFIGIQYYGPTVYQVKIGGGDFIGVENFVNPTAKITNDMGWEIYPYGIYEISKKAYERYQKPIVITENGIADKKDSLRGEFIEDHLYWVSKAVSEGVPIKGYIHRSLLDNFEWDKGFWPRFGLIEVNYEDGLRRTIRPSANKYKQIIQNNK